MKGDGPAAEENELTRALQRRRKVVDAKGSKFEKEPVVNTENAADVKWDESHENQFTPKSRHKNAASAAAALAEAVDHQSSSDTPADTPVALGQKPATCEAPDQISSGDSSAHPPASSSEKELATGQATDLQSSSEAPADPAVSSPAVTATASSSVSDPAPPVVAVEQQDAERSRADAAKAALLHSSDIAEKLPPMESLPERKVPTRLSSAFQLGVASELGPGKRRADAGATYGDNQGDQANTARKPEKLAAEGSPHSTVIAPVPADAPIVTVIAATAPAGTFFEKSATAPAKEIPAPAVVPSSPLPGTAVRVPPHTRVSEAPMPNALKTPTPAAGVERMVSTPLQQHQTGGGTDPMMWRAVVEGDVHRLEDFAARGALSSGRLTDQNGHSIFWNAVAFQKAEVALWLLRRFPPDSADCHTAVDLSEVHVRRRDSLLHLCMYFNDFTASAAELFRHVFAGGGSSSSQAPRDLVNQNGQTFLSVAAARLNFWALRFVLSQSPSCVSIFRKAGPHMPLEVFLRRVRETAGPFLAPAPLPPPPTEAQLPAWCKFSRHAPRSTSVSSSCGPAFADLIVEVEDPKADGGMGRVAAHRVIVGACSGKLDAQIRKLPAGEALRLDSLCCRSEEVLIALMGFIYTGEVAISFKQDAFLLWQLLCLCVQYSMPAVLTTYTRTALVSSLREPRYAAVMPVLLQAADKVGLAQDEASFVAGMLAGSPQALDSLEGETRQAQAILAALVAIEKHVQGSTASSAAARAPAAVAAPAPVPSYAPAPTPLPTYREMY